MTSFLANSECPWSARGIGTRGDVVPRHRRSVVLREGGSLCRSRLSARRARLNCKGFVTEYCFPVHGKFLGFGQPISFIEVQVQVEVGLSLFAQPQNCGG
jgi:hypothetical protein